MRKKLVPILLMVVIVFNFIFCNSVYSDEESGSSSNSRYGGNGVVDGEAARGLVENGTDSSGNTMVHTNYGISLLGVLLQAVASIIDSFPMTIQAILTSFTYSRVVNRSEKIANMYDNKVNTGNPLNDVITSAVLTLNSYHYTIESTVFDEIAIFNIDIFNQKNTYTNGIGDYTEEIKQDNNILKLKESATEWFYVIRLLASMINLCVLIYVGIKMAITTVASEEAKYKKMIIWWAESMIMLFCLQYIFYIIIFFEKTILNIINLFRYQLIISGGAVSFEKNILDRIYLSLIIEGGARFFLYSLFFWFLTFIHIKFFITYLKRTFTILFLVIISPLITVTYPIDKLDNGKAEAFEKWLKEFFINAFIQPIHAIIYLVFVYTAGKIAEKAPWVAMIFLISLGRIENIVRNIFKVTDSVENVNKAVKGGKGPRFGMAMRMLAGKK
ncbi:MAG: hypothetical protein IKM97_06090 [Clostridia bacterium]|nr:hypothetical protein [Clostridia bacterium]